MGKRYRARQQEIVDGEIMRLLVELQEPNSRPKTLKELSSLLERARESSYEKCHLEILSSY